MTAGCKPPTDIATGMNGKRQINYYDLDGTRVEIMEPGIFDGKPVPPYQPASAGQKAGLTSPEYLRATSRAQIQSGPDII